MSSDVVLTSALRSNLQSLQNTQRLIDDTQLKLATGLKVNSALDNPQSFFAAQSLNNRASDLTRLLDGISQSIRTIEEADNGITALTDLVEQAESVAIEAQSEARASEGFARIRGDVDLSGTENLVTYLGGATTASFGFSVQFTPADADAATDVITTNITIANGETVDNIVADINSDTAINDYVKASVSSNGQLVLQSLDEGGILRIEDTSGATSLGAAGFEALGLSGVVNSEEIGSTGSAGLTQRAGSIIAGREISSVASTAATVNNRYEASALLTDAGFISNVTGTEAISLNIEVDGSAASAITLNATATIQDVVDGINNDAVLSEAGVTASFDTTTGELDITVADSVSSLDIGFSVDTGGTHTGDIGFGFGSFQTDVSLDSTGGNTNISESFTFTGSSVDLDQYEEDFNNIRSQIDDLVGDASYRGVNLLNGDDLTTDFNEDRTSSLTTEGVDFTSLGLGVDEASFTNSATIQESIDEIRAALGEVRNFGQTIANDLAVIQTRRDFTESTIGTLESGADDLTVADQNEEGANLLALQTRQTLGVTSLSLASQSQQAVLRLF
ncbi:MAG: flagellin [Alphaproteobacteria bacterium]|nr:flagellin [Alphaproteobacteria bacterium]HCQ70952.1 flagellin [Rhodospirillaceae bacterium]|tara:strand:- start:6400 stop:8091 length:1692 start_codon:yes stop_codon:yes gene_type:complete